MVLGMVHAASDTSELAWASSLVSDAAKGVEQGDCCAEYAGVRASPAAHRHPEESLCGAVSCGRAHSLCTPCVTTGTATKTSSCAMARIVAEPIHEFSIFAPIQHMRRFSRLCCKTSCTPP